MTSKTPRTVIFAAAIAAVAILGLSTEGRALVITGGPIYTLPGGGTCSVSGTTTVTSPNGATVTCTGVSLGSHTNVYFGIRNDINQNGNNMVGATPSNGAGNIFRISSTTASSITYTSSASYASSSGAVPSQSVTNRLIVTITGGSASVVATGGTPANSTPNGDIADLFKLNSGTSFTFTVDLDATSGSFATGQACPAVYDPGHASAGAAGDVSKVDVAFYYSDCGDGVLDSPEQCDQGSGVNGTVGSCCASNCTFKSTGTACTDDGNQCTNDQCNGSSQVCQHPAKPSGTACTGNGTGECSNADTCNGSGTCLNNDVPSNTPCTDTTPTDCKAARCNGSNVCVQTFTNETNGTACAGNGTGECSLADTCLSGVCQDNDVAAATPCSDFTPTDCIAAQCNGLGTCDQTFGLVANGSPCSGNGVSDCSSADTCLGGTCQNNDLAASTPCGDLSDTVCDNPDSCDGSGTCLANNEPNTVVCRAATSGGVCDEPENCDGAGNCPADGFKPTSTICRSSAGQCDAAEHCTGFTQLCPPDGFAPASTPCGDPTNTQCDNPDTCDGNNNCLSNYELAGTACGSPSDTDCDNPDTCNGSGTCLINNEPSGTACGDPSNTDCTDPDTCDGAANCLPNNASNGTSCNDGDNCTTGETCTSGSCGNGTDVCPDLDHYKCYQGKDIKNPKFLKVTVATQDQLATESVDVKKIKFVCTPVDKNGEGINAPNRHIVCYQLKAPTFGARPKVQVSTQFQSSQFEIKKGKLLCLPATKQVIP